jgi:hypothetical protein
MYLSTELAEVLGMLRHLHLFYLFSQTSTIPGTYVAKRRKLLRMDNSYRKEIQSYVI